MHSAAMKRYQMIQNIENPECFTSNAVDYPTTELLQAEMRTHWHEAQRSKIVVLPLRHSSQHARRFPVNRRADKWTEAEQEIIARVYPTGSIAAVREELLRCGFRDRTKRAIWGQAHKQKVYNIAGAKFNRRTNTETKGKERARYDHNVLFV